MGCYQMSYKMNTVQTIAFDRFVKFAKYTDSYEIKELSIRDSYGDAYVCIEIGVKDDEGTLAEIICRDFYTFFIGKRGGIYQYNNNYNKIYRKYYEVEKSGI